MRMPVLYWGSLMCSLLVAAPILIIALGWFLTDKGAFAYLLESRLISLYAYNSTVIALLAGATSLVIGVGAAWAVTMWEFPFRRLLQWLLVLPLAMPAYVAAMVYGHLLEGAGPVQTALREWTGLAFGQYYFPEIRSLGGVVLILSVTLYPYVYLLARGAFLTQSRHMLETGELLGLSRWQLFRRLALPMARPALVAGVALVMMEALADFGVVSLFGVPSFTTGIYRAWQGMFDPVAAARMAFLLLVLVLVALWMERRARGAAVYQNTSGLYHPLVRLEIDHKWLVAGLCALPVVLGFFLPAGLILAWSMENLGLFADSSTLQAVGNSLLLAGLTAITAGVIGVFFAYVLRAGAPVWVAFFIRIATAGYAIPGSVIAVGVLLLFILLQNQIPEMGWLLTGSIIGVVWGCSLRFLTVAFQSAEAGLARVTSDMDAAATTLGARNRRIILTLHLPMVSASLLAGLLLVFVDTLKELPATLLLRPFNFDTLAIRTFELAGDELLQRAAPTALLLVLASILPVWYLNRRMAGSRPDASGEHP